MGRGVWGGRVCRVRGMNAGGESPWRDLGTWAGCLAVAARVERGKRGWVYRGAHHGMCPLPWIVELLSGELRGSSRG
jgi:hypothetical protein